jgi:hypothetical protein
MLLTLDCNLFHPGAGGRDDIPLLLEGSFKPDLNWIYLRIQVIQLTDWLFGEVALLLIGLTKIS